MPRIISLVLCVSLRHNNKEKYLNRVAGFDEKKKLLIIQTFNQTGDKEGKPLPEQYKNLWYLPRLLSMVQIDGEPHSVDRYVYETIYGRIDILAAVAECAKFMSCAG